MANLFKNKKFRLLLKIAVTVIALYFVYNKVDVNELLNTIAHIKWVYFLLAILAFLVSKIISSFRLNAYFKCVDIHISERQNWRLYMLGMFYNLFLPGGIGGDGYKVYILNQKFSTPVKQLVQATILDRLSGLFAILVLALACINWIDFGLSWLPIAANIAIPVGTVVYYFGLKILFKTFTPVFTSTTLLSMLVQIGQVLAAYFILLAINVEAGYTAYIFIFLAASLSIVFPFSIGGLGLREYVAVEMANQGYFEVDKGLAVAMASLFFVVTALVSLFGVYFVWFKKQLWKK